ncbi:hypothetical protein SK128_016118, partial [Halocaridina rubra]
RDCHGPLRHSRHSHGLRCPRNQPAALWELLQQSLARNPKLSSWTKTHLLSWSPTDTRHTYWPRIIPPAPRSAMLHYPESMPSNLDAYPTLLTNNPRMPQGNIDTLHSTQIPELQDP